MAASCTFPFIASQHLACTAPIPPQLHDAQTAVLQHQINSHFLFNTLENIKTISVTELGIDNEVDIYIHIYRQENDLVIHIQDNGYGLKGDYLKELQQLNSDMKTDQTHHVGIQNVHKRITNVFGARYGISMENTPPGTTVTILYPITPQP